MASAIHDNAALHRYELEIDGITAFATYRRADGVITVLHVEVPERLSGRGVGSTLARGVLDLIRAKGWTLVAKCPFLAGFIAKHTEYEDLLDGPGGSAQAEKDALDARLDEALEETFPGSDSPAVTPKH